MMTEKKNDGERVTGDETHVQTYPRQDARITPTYQQRKKLTELVSRAL